MKMASPAPSDSSSSSTSSSSSAASTSDALATKPQPPPSPSPVFAPRPVRAPQGLARFQRPFVVVDDGSGAGPLWRWRSATTPSPGLREDIIGGRRRAGSVSSISSTSSALGGTRLESVDEGYNDGSSEAGDDHGPSLNRDILEELRTITRLPPASIDRSKSPGYNGRIAPGMPSESPSSLQRRSPLATEGVESNGSNSGHRRMLSDLNGKRSPNEGWKRPFPSPISRKLMRNPILHNKDFDQE